VNRLRVGDLNRRERIVYDVLHGTAGDGCSHDGTSCEEQARRIVAALDTRVTLWSPDDDAAHRLRVAAALARGECPDCGQPLTAPGAPGICAAGHEPDPEGTSESGHEPGTGNSSGTPESGHEPGTHNSEEEYPC